ncbi:MAG: CDP-diacylglycerol--glycerol-3-phosphate 3-phosphatidyltransferase [Alphaproteobacteria bacterium]
MLWTLPNLLTLGRVVAVPVIVGLMFVPSDAVRWLAALLFAAAAVTDWFDGWLARARGQTSAFGRFLDPIADKVLVILVLVMLVADGTVAHVHVVAVLVIVAREILVAGLREFLAGDSVAMPVTFLAKCKTTVQLVAIVVLMVAPMTGQAVHVVGLVLLWAAAAATAVTGADYLRRGIAHVVARDRAGG